PVRQLAGAVATRRGGRQRHRVRVPPPEPDTRRRTRQACRRATAAAAGNPPNDLVRTGRDRARLTDKLNHTRWAERHVPDLLPSPRRPTQAAALYSLPSVDVLDSRRSQAY